MADPGDPIERPDNYRTLVFAFAVWAAHFAGSYAGVLISPGQSIARWIAFAALAAATAALALKARSLARPRPRLALLALGIALAAIVFGTFPAIVG